MASIVISQLTQALSFLREHPKLACVLLLLLSSPMYRILFYFSPLLLSTALCIFALITLTPYFTATDAEVEMQSMRRPSSQQPKKKIITTATAGVSKDRKLEDVSGYGRPSSFSASRPPSSAAEASWSMWMKGLNDIGRAWMESKLTEQGLALSEPANRETLLALIEGSFAHLITAQESPSVEVFSAIDNHRVAELAHPKEKNDEALQESTIDCVSEVYSLQKSIKDEEVVCTNATFVGDEEATTENVRNEETVASESRAAKAASNVCCEEASGQSYAVHEVKCVQDSVQLEPLLDDVKVRNQKLLVAHVECDMLPVTDGIPDTPAAINIPKTPSRVPVPSRLLEASRRIFSKEEQSKSMLSRAPLQTSFSVRANQPCKPSHGSFQSKMESSVSLFKLPARRFLDRSQSIPSKEGSKPKTTFSTLESQSSSEVVQGKVKEGTASCVNSEDVFNANDGVHDAIDGVCDVNDGSTDVCISDLGDFAGSAVDDGPRFDEGLEVEEAQALVQSELKMLDVELEEVAAKLPKLDEAAAYQKTPVHPIKSAAALIASTGASIKCRTTTLFAATSNFKTS